MFGLKFKLEGLYFTTFRNPTSTSLIMSYPVPPYTTIRGLISNALGLERDDLSVQEWIKIGIKPINISDKSREMAKILKLKGTGEKYEKIFPSSPIFREYLVSPIYEIYIYGNEDKIEKIYYALLQPMRPLYIGSSDDLVDIEVGKITEIKEISAKKIYSVVEGIHESCYIERIPYKFIRNGKNFSLVYKTISIPKRGILNLDKEIKCWRFGEENIWMV